MRLSSHIASATSVPGGLRHPSPFDVIYEVWRKPPQWIWGGGIAVLTILFSWFITIIQAGIAAGLALLCAFVVYHITIIVISMIRIYRIKRAKGIGRISRRG